MIDDTGSRAAVLNLEDTLARFGGDRDLLGQMSSILLDDAPQIAHDLRLAIERRDATAIRAKAHALKGLVLGCGGERAGHAAHVLEDAGHRNELNTIDSQLVTLEQELNQLFAALHTLVEHRVTA